MLPFPKHLEETLKARLQHYLEPGHDNILNREPSECSIHEQDE